MALRANRWDSQEKTFHFSIFFPSPRCVFSVDFRHVTKMCQVKCQHVEQVIKLEKWDSSYGGPAARRQTNSLHFSRGCIRFGLNFWAPRNRSTGAQSEMRLKSHLFPWFHLGTAKSFQAFRWAVPFRGVKTFCSLVPRGRHACRLPDEWHSNKAWRSVLKQPRIPTRAAREVTRMPVIQPGPSVCAPSK